MLYLSLVQLRKIKGVNVYFLIRPFNHTFVHIYIPRAHNNRLTETVLLSTHNICSGCEINMIFNTHSYLDTWLSSKAVGKTSHYHFTRNTPASNLGYLAPPPRTIFHGCQIVHWDPLDGKRRCPQKNFGLGYVKLHGFYANP